MRYNVCMNKAVSIRAFTLVELALSIGIIGLLSGVILASTVKARASARDTRRVGDMQEIQLGLALYFEVNKSYPAGSGTGVLGVLVTQKYLPEIPADPAGGAYEYLSYNNNKNYCIGVKLEGAIPSDNVTSAMNPNCNGLTNSNYKASR